MQSLRYEFRRLYICAEEARGRILDLGHAQLPNPYLPGSLTTGVDLSRPVISSGYSADLIGSVMQLGKIVGNDRFDTVVAGELVEHLEQPYEFLREVRSVLAPGGRLVLSTPNPLGFPTLFLELTRSRRYFYTADHTYYFLPRWVGRLLERTGFELRKIRPVGLWLPFGYVRWCPIWCSYQLVFIATAAE